MTDVTQGRVSLLAELTARASAAKTALAQHAHRMRISLGRIDRLGDLPVNGEYRVLKCELVCEKRVSSEHIVEVESPDGLVRRFLWRTKPPEVFWVCETPNGERFAVYNRDVAMRLGAFDPPKTA